MPSRSLSRELALLMLAQVPDRQDRPAPATGRPPEPASLGELLHQALAALSQHVRDTLDRAAEDLAAAQRHLLDSELQEAGEQVLPRVRGHLEAGIAHGERALNRLSASLELPRLLLLADQEAVRRGAIDRARAVLEEREALDAELDGVMERWRMARLPRIDRDILRLAAVDLLRFGTPPAVACNEAVELANRYSDDQGRRRINGVLRRFTAARAKV
ncbi:MAG: transcription antitermination factor NusB [Synechococcaceae cyanobacterium]|nr:transcription antitermination factor NusB [Synechococcaceae cyanobacterium]